MLNPRPSEMERDAFVARFADIYEHSAWIAEAVYDRGLSGREDSADGLAEAMGTVLAGADDEAKLRLIRAHPDLAGRAAIAGDLTTSSKSEQAGAGLDQCTPDEFRRFQGLNDGYKTKFGFPFILAVAGRDRHQILDAFEERIRNDPAEEFREALRQIDRIARLRLQAMEG